MCPSPFHRLEDLLAESRFGKRRALSWGQLAIKPGRTVAGNLLLQFERGKDTDRGLRAALSIIAGRTLHEVLRNPPMVGVDTFDDPGMAQRFQSPDMTADVTIGVATGDADDRTALGQSAMRARAVNAAALME